MRARPIVTPGGAAGTTHYATAKVADREVRYQPPDTLILPPTQVHQIFAGTESEFVSAMSIGGTVKLPDGVVIDLPWRK